MAWTSPRKDGENAKAMAERMARAYEEELGRSLTAEELAQVHAEAAKTVKAWGKATRRT